MISYHLYFSAFIGTIAMIFWFYLMHKGRKEFQEFIEPLSAKEHPFKKLYVVGFQLLEMMNYRYQTPIDRKRISQTRLLYGTQYGDYYYRVNLAEKLTFILTLLIYFLFFYSIIHDVSILVFGTVLLGFSYWYIDQLITSKVAKRKKLISQEFPHVLAKLTLLINAGMVVKDAWNEVANTGNNLIYQEMQMTIDEIDNGISETEAYIHFGNRCGLLRTKKFSSMLVQNISKGSQELVDFLKQITHESWEEKKHEAKRLGEIASSKLVLPIGIMFIGILVMIIVPIFGGLQF